MNSAYTFLPYIETELTIEIIEFEAGEENKNIDTCVWNVLTELSADKKVLLLIWEVVLSQI
jgi:3-dehydroquinate synthase